VVLVFPSPVIIISNFSYADDLAFVNNCPCKLQEFLNIFSKNAEKICLLINLSKTVCMSTEKEQSSMHILINNNEMKHT